MSATSPVNNMTEVLTDNSFVDEGICMDLDEEEECSDMDMKEDDNGVVEVENDDELSDMEVESEAAEEEIRPNRNPVLLNDFCPNVRGNGSPSACPHLD